MVPLTYPQMIAPTVKLNLVNSQELYIRSHNHKSAVRANHNRTKVRGARGKGVAFGLNNMNNENEMLRIPACPSKLR